MLLRTRAALAAAAILALLGSSAPAAYAASEVSEVGAQIAVIRQATATFKHFDADALAAAGYVLELPDGDGVTFCIDKPGVGGMGIHFVNPAALAPGFDLTQPEVLVYEPDDRGVLTLVAVEFVVFDADLPEGSPDPVFLGRTLERLAGPGEEEAQNRYGLPAFWELHVWLWKNNPTGMFEDYNPKVVCPEA